MKSLVLAAACATAFALPALAEDAATDAKPDRPRHEMREHMRHEGGKMREAFKADRKEFREEHKAEFDAARKDCEAKRKAATTDEARDAATKDCRAKHDEMRKEAFDDKTKLIEKHRAEMDAKRDEMRAKRDAAKEAVTPKAE